MELDVIALNKEARENTIKGVYILKQDSKIVYIGMSSICVYGRIQAHRRTKEFNNYEIIECEWDEAYKIEEELIRKHKPKYNKQLKSPYAEETKLVPCTKRFKKFMNEVKKEKNLTWHELLDELAIRLGYKI